MKPHLYIFILFNFFLINLLSGNDLNDQSVALQIGQSLVDNNCNRSLSEGVLSTSCSGQALNSSVWYRFTTSDKKEAIDLNFTNYNLGAQSSLTLYDEWKSSVIWQSCNSKDKIDFPIAFTSLEENKTYFLQISSTEESEGEYEIGLTRNIALPPSPNDLCTGAIQMFGNGILECGDDTEQIFNDLSGTGDPEATGNCVSPTEPGLWFTFSTPADMAFESIFSALIPTGFELFSSTSGCGGLVYVDCAASSFLEINLDPNTQYYILLGAEYATFWIPGNNLTTECDDPIDYLGPGTNTFPSENICETSSSLVPCENENVNWWSYTSGCELTDIIIDIEPYTSNLGFGPADEISIVAVMDDCTTVMSAYDPAGLGYVCSAMSANETLELNDVPPYTSFVIGFGSNSENTGHFDITVTETDPGISINDECVDAIELITGVNTDLNNYCSTNDLFISQCGADQSEASVWFTFDEGFGPQDISIQINSNGIADPAIAAYENCGGVLLGKNCNDNLLELNCVVVPIVIQIASSTGDVGEFDIEIDASPASFPPDPIITVSDICYGEHIDLEITFPGGLFGNIDVDISNGSSSSITGMANHSFTGVNSIMISDQLFNSENDAQIAIYTISFSVPGYTCLAQDIEVPISVNSQFSAVTTNVDECLPYNLQLNANDIITGGTGPYTSFNWLWNNVDVLSNTNLLDIDLTESGDITLIIEDAVGCSHEASFSVMVAPVEAPSFDFPLMYCRSDSDLIELITTSVEGIEGTWDPPFIWVEDYPDGMVEFTFTPDDASCTSILEIEIEIYSGDPLVFDLPDFICSDEGTFTFPNTDLNGIPGSWDYSTLDVSNLSGPFSNMFYPNSSDCYAIYEYDFEIQDQIELNFNFPDTVCRNDGLITLDATSQEGYSGIWNILQFNPDTVTGNTFMSTWVPLAGQSSCIGDTTIMVEIIDLVDPIFNLPATLCSLDTLFDFPTMTIDSIFSGTWSVTQIDPAQANGEITSTFTAGNGSCSNDFEWTINIELPTTPSFTIDTALCSLDAIFTLPEVSENGISGTWSPATIDPVNLGGLDTMVTFTAASTHSCVEPWSLTFYVEEATVPVFNLPDTLCWDEQDLVLPLTSVNGIEGVWSTPILDIQNNLGGTLISTFSPNGNDCQEVYQYQVYILAPYQVDVQTTDPTDCDSMDGMISLNTSITDLEYSIDGGVSWQTAEQFDLLSAGIYLVLVRNINFTTCILPLEAVLSSPGSPNVISIIGMPLSGCTTTDGIIQINATGSNLEYSIDNGLTWQSSNTFNNLPEGIYTVSIRQENSTSCIIMGDVEIEAFPTTEILDVNIIDISDCNQEDAQIQILASGQNNEYSINGGIDWSSDFTFQNLAAGQYEIIVQSADAPDCIDLLIVDIDAIDSPIIGNVNSQNPSVCELSSGTIEIEAIGNNLEYSIDGGITWFSDPLFLNLVAQSYSIIVRDALRTECFDEWDLELIEIDDNLSMADHILTPISECNAEDAIIEITISETDVEFSIDGGATWQTNPFFMNLGAGMYTIIIRKMDAPDCATEVLVDVENADCPCNDLVVDLQSFNTHCNDQNSPGVYLAAVQGMMDSDIDWVWQNGATSDSIIGVTDGWQSITIAYDEVCEWTDSIWVEIDEPIDFEVIVQDADCDVSANGFIEVINITGGNGNFSFSLDGVNFQDSNIFQNLTSNTYEITVSDDNNCALTQFVEVFAEVEITFDFPENITIDAGELITLDPGIILTAIDSFRWNSNAGILDANSLVITVSPDVTTIYTLEVFYGDCSFTADVIIEVIEDEDFYLGNIFSPNDDGFNNVFYVQAGPNSSISILDFIIYDRWGNQLFYKENPSLNDSSSGWDGTFKGRPVNPGVYVYLVKYRTTSGIENTVIGHLTLVI